MSLTTVKFHKFREAIKKYGNNQKLKEEHLRSISETINLDVDEMMKDKNALDNFFYKDEGFTWKDGEYDPTRLMFVGFLFCHYEDAETHQGDMWLLLNPQNNDTVNKHEISSFFQNLFYISADQRASKIQLVLFQIKIIYL